MNSKSILFLSLLFCLFLSCNVQKIGKDAGKGFDQNTQSIARNLMAGINQGLSDPEFKKNLYQLVDSLVGTAGGSANKTVQRLMDSVLTDSLIHYTERLVEAATGSKLRANVDAVSLQLRSTLQNMLGAETRARVRLLVAAAMSEATGPKMQAAFASLREQLTGPEMRSNLYLLKDSLLNNQTNAAIKAIVDTAMLTIAFRMKHDVNGAFQENLTFLQRNATGILIVAGIIAVIIIFIIWRLKEKYAKMTTLIASEIHAMPNQKEYDALTSRIKNKAMTAGVEPTLRKVLEDNGLLGKENRDNWQNKQISMMHQ